MLGLLAALAVACGDAEGAGGPDGGGGPPAPVVEVLRVERSAIRNDADLLGQLEASESVTVRARVPGTIEAIGFEEGEPVEKGQVLFRLDDAEARARLREARAELALAEDRHRRTRDLAERRVVSQAQVEQVRAELEVARARVEAADVALDHTRVYAPFDGVAGHRLVSLGARVEPEVPLVTVESIATLELMFTLPEQALPLARTGVRLHLTVAPYPGERFPADVTFVAPSLNAANRRLLVKARVPNPDLRLRPGLFAEVEASLGTREGIVVPASAIDYGSQGSFVWRVGADDVVEQVPVELGLRRGDRVEVRVGLEPGDRVVVAGTNKLTPGARIDAIVADEREPDAAAPVARPGGDDGVGDGVTS